MRRAPSDLGPCEEPGPCGGGRRLELGPKRRARDRQEQRDPLERTHAELALGRQRVPDGNDEDEVLLEERGDRDVGSGRREVEDREIDLAGRQLSVEPGGRGLDEDEAELGISLRSDAHQLGHEPPGSCADDPDPNRSCDVVGEGDDVREQGVQLRLHPPGAGNDELSSLGQVAVRAVHELTAQLSLELLDMSRDVGLHGLERVGGGRERAVVVDGDESAQLA